MAARAESAPPARSTSQPSSGGGPSTGSGTASAGHSDAGSAAQAETPKVEAGKGDLDEQQQKQARAEAAQRFQRGLGFYGDGDYALALIEFDRAYQLVPDFRVLYNIGQVSIQLGRFARARQALQQYMAEGGETLSAERKAEVERDLTMLNDRTAFLKLVVSEDQAEVLVDDRSFGLTPLAEPLLLDAGEHRLVVRKTGFNPFSERVTLAGAEELPLTVALTSTAEDKPVVIVQRPEETTVDSKSPPQTSSGADDRRGPSPALIGWISTGALAAGAAVTGVLGLSAHSNYETLKNTPDVDADELNAAANEAQALLVTADILGVAAIATGGVSLYLSLRKPQPRSSALRSSFGGRPGAPELHPAVLVLQPNRVLLQGQF